MTNAERRPSRYNGPPAEARQNTHRNDQTMIAPHRHTERHSSDRIGWLRAAVRRGRMNASPAEYFR